jgi:hypothetical protein
MDTRSNHLMNAERDVAFAFGLDIESDVLWNWFLLQWRGLTLRFRTRIVEKPLLILVHQSTQVKKVID